jgi:hypothetical protein
MREWFEKDVGVFPMDFDAVKIFFDITSLLQ